MCSIIGVGEWLHKVLGQIDLGTLDSGEQSLPFGLLVYFRCLSLKNGITVLKLAYFLPGKHITRDKKTSAEILLM